MSRSLNHPTATAAWDDAQAAKAQSIANDSRRALSAGWHGYRVPGAELALSLVIAFGMGLLLGGFAL